LPKNRFLDDKKVPVGTLSYHKHSKENPTSLREDCVWTLYFSFSPNDLLDCVEKGEYKVNKTKQNWIAQEQFNYEVWDPTSWVGVDIP
jgi:RNA-binding protein YlmH